MGGHSPRLAAYVFFKGEVMKKLFIAIFILVIGSTTAFAGSVRSIDPAAPIGAVGQEGTSESASAFWDQAFPSAQQDAKVWAVACCKVCRKGKACGNSCINRSYTCRKGPGCACNGY